MEVGAPAPVMTTKEVDMFARKVSMQLKANSVTEFTQRIEKDILPLLRKQTGFRDEITFVVTGGTEAFAISLWENKENAEAYSRGSYPEVAKILARVVEGTPKVETYEVANSTFHKIAAAAGA
jgi:heme-degrading monooxygenase HmoA